MKMPLVSVRARQCVYQRASFSTITVDPFLVGNEREKQHQQIFMKYGSFYNYVVEHQQEHQTSIRLMAEKARVKRKAESKPPKKGDPPNYELWWRSPPKLQHFKYFKKGVRAPEREDQ
eukprot:GHVN01059288.1.p2 GENE.GHVN01059288.1~~GHVN01059288.1.p2  ORF type:complete len:118 (+),score=10.93 GHVN01059288.1:51-404(+)